jgi:hypothetical protein
VCQHGPRDDVADGIDVGHLGAEVIIHLQCSTRR